MGSRPVGKQEFVLMGEENLFTGVTGETNNNNNTKRKKGAKEAAGAEKAPQSTDTLRSMCSQDVTQKPGQVMQYYPHPKQRGRGAVHTRRHQKS